MAFMAGLFLAVPGRPGEPALAQRIVLPWVAYTAGFVLVYSLLIATGLGAGKFLLYYIHTLRTAAGIMVLFAGLYILLPDRPGLAGIQQSRLFVGGLSLLTGVSFAIIYAPCITPTMSAIMGLASRRETAVEGWYLALVYGGGISVAFGAVALVLILWLGRSAVGRRNMRRLKGCFGAIVLLLALLNMTGLMRHYKAMILGSVL